MCPYTLLTYFVPPDYSAKHLPKIDATIARFSLLHSNLKFSPVNLHNLRRIVGTQANSGFTSQSCNSCIIVATQAIGYIWIKHICVSFGIVAVGSECSHFI